MSIYMPEYNNSILGIPNSILKHYGAKAHHESLAILDEKLQKPYKNIVLWVLDGLGYEALKAHAPNGFLMRNCVDKISSVYPCTTTSAITSFESGLSPIEHGWLGWSLYFKEINKCVDLFTNKESATDRVASESNVAWETIPYKHIFDQIRETNNHIECCKVSPFSEYWTNTNEGVCKHIEELCKKEGQRYIYAYHFQPDMAMHEYGCYSEQSKAHIVLFDKQIEELTKSLKDTLLIISADHGLTDINSLFIEDFPEINKCLALPPTREARCISFFIKEGYENTFKEVFEKQFSSDFILMTTEEALEKNLFGLGKPHKYSRDFLGHYIALATSNLSLWYRREDGSSHNFKGHHSGLTKEEMIVPLILIEGEMK